MEPDRSVHQSAQRADPGKQVRRRPRPAGNILSIVVPAADGAVQGSGRVLVVDTESELRLALKTLLSAAGLTVDDADSHDAALDRLDTGTFDLALFDINMPGINGLETCQRIRARSQASIVMLDLKGEGPFESAELPARIQSGLSRKSCPAIGARRYSDLAVLRLIAAADRQRLAIVGTCPVPSPIR